MNTIAIPKLSDRPDETNRLPSASGPNNRSGNTSSGHIGPGGLNKAFPQPQGISCAPGVRAHRQPSFPIGSAASDGTDERALGAVHSGPSASPSFVGRRMESPRQALDLAPTEAIQAELVPTADIATASVRTVSESRLKSAQSTGKRRGRIRGGDAVPDALEVLWRESSRQRQRKCRRVPSGASNGTVAVHRSERGTYFTGLQTCGHATCPVCGPTIRERERERMIAVVSAHLASGGAVYLFLLSLSHGPFDKLGDLLDALDAGRSAAIGGKGGSRWAKDRRDFEIVGTSWHREDVNGKNGWHPHFHGLLFTDRELTDTEVEQLQSRIYGRHRDTLKALGYKTLASFNSIERVREPEKLPGYLTKGRTVSERVAAEVTRGDRKVSKGVSPWGLLDRYIGTGDMADLDLFRDYESASAGRHWRYLSPALTKRYGTVAKSVEVEEWDTEAAEAQDRTDAQDAVGGVEVMRIALTTWRVLTGTLGAVTALRRLVHAGDLDAARELVARAESEAQRQAQDRSSERGTWGRRWGPYSEPGVAEKAHSKSTPSAPR